MSIVYTHLRPGHIDDVVGTSVLAALLGAEVDFIHQQDARIPRILEDPHAATVDVGGAYDPTKLHFDHHHDHSLPCAAVLVLREVGAWQSSAGWVYMSIKDTMGPHEAALRMRETSTPRDIHTERLISCMTPSAKLGMRWLQAGLADRRFDTFGGLVTWLHRHAGDEIVDQAEQVHRMLAARGALALESSFAFSMRLPNGQTVRVVMPGAVQGERHPLPATEALRKHAAGLLVSPSEYPGEHASWKIVRAESLRERIDFSRLRGDHGVSFAHNSGYMAVIEGPLPIDARATERAVAGILGRAWIEGDGMPALKSA